MFKLLIGTVSVISSAFHLKRSIDKGSHCSRKKFHFGNGMIRKFVPEFQENSAWNGKLNFSDLPYITQIFFCFMEWKPEISGTLISGMLKKKSGFYFQTRKNSEIHSINQKNSSFHSVNGKNFQVLFHKRENFSSFQYWNQST